VLAYHRVGDRSLAAYDPWVYSTDADHLDEQVRYIKKHRRLVGLEEALEIVAGRIRDPGEATLLTFDDGYLDNYEVAFPILKAQGAEAVFFVVTSFAAGGVIPWWDQIAWIVKSARADSFQLASRDGPVKFHLDSTNRADVVTKVLDLYKGNPSEAPDEFIQELEQSCDSVRPDANARMFFSWNEAREMQAAGMRIAAHTDSHRILASLSPTDQRAEVDRSQQILERELQTPIDVMAYPVGSADAFNTITEQVLAECGYRAAFSCHGGINGRFNSRLFDIKRIPVWWGAEPAWLFEG